MTASLLTIGCSRSGEVQPPVPYQLSLDIRQTMNQLLEPAADRIWDSAGVVVTIEGEEDLTPTTDEEWAAVVHAASVLTESGNLLMLPGRAYPGADWTEFSQALNQMGQKALVAANARDGDALFQAGADLYSVCLACHQMYAPGMQRVQD